MVVLKLPHLLFLAHLSVLLYVLEGCTDICIICLACLPACHVYYLDVNLIYLTHTSVEVKG